MIAEPIRIDLTKISSQITGGTKDNIIRTIRFMEPHNFPNLEGTANNGLKITVSYTDENTEMLDNCKYFKYGSNTTLYKIILTENFNNNNIISTNCILKVSELIGVVSFDEYFNKYENKYLSDKILNLEHAKIPEIKYYGKINNDDPEQKYFYTIVPIYNTDFDNLVYAEKLLFLKNVVLFLCSLTEKKYYIVDFKLENFGYNKIFNDNGETTNVGCILIDYDDDALYQYLLDINKTSDKYKQKWNNMNELNTYVPNYVAQLIYPYTKATEMERVSNKMDSTGLAVMMIKLFLKPFFRIISDADMVLSNMHVFLYSPVRNNTQLKYFQDGSIFSLDTNTYYAVSDNSQIISGFIDFLKPIDRDIKPQTIETIKTIIKNLLSPEYEGIPNYDAILLQIEDLVKNGSPTTNITTFGGKRYVLKQI